METPTGTRPPPSLKVRLFLVSVSSRPLPPVQSNLPGVRSPLHPPGGPDRPDLLYRRKNGKYRHISKVTRTSVTCRRKVVLSLHESDPLPIPTPSPPRTPTLFTLFLTRVYSLRDSSVCTRKLIFYSLSFLGASFELRCEPK